MTMTKQSETNQTTIRGRVIRDRLNSDHRKNDWKPIKQKEQSETDHRTAIERMIENQS